MILILNEKTGKFFPVNLDIKTMKNAMNYFICNDWYNDKLIYVGF